MTSTPPCIVVGATDRGLRRARNEDSFTVFPEHGVAVVADGMGGHPGGDVASEIAARTTADRLRRVFPHGSETNDPGADPATSPSTDHITRKTRERAMRQSVLDAHQAVLSRGRAEPSLTGMGTTTTALVVDADAARYTVGNVGDSRAYLLRDGRLEQLTRDDTRLQELIEAGAVRPEDAMGHPESHMLTQCVGLAPAPVPRVVEDRTRPGDVFLLCSDGLIACLRDTEIRAILTRSLDGTAAGAERAVARLIEETNAAGGVDNVTVVVISIPEHDA
ncbi:MAG: protein phosphatase 2C domain-containing protein [Gemmatimonadota bacterium]|nr:protein phosphatase 2C domain-containing protein [Gemmatimonadota bacterium]